MHFDGWMCPNDTRSSTGFTRIARRQSASARSPSWRADFRSHGMPSSRIGPSKWRLACARENAECTTSAEPRQSRASLIGSCVQTPESQGLYLMRPIRLVIREPRI